MSKRTGRRPVEISVKPEDIVLWKCAAALEPVPPTWAGVTWQELLATPFADGSMTVMLPTRFTAEYRTREDRETMFISITYLITNQAELILERHGLQRIPIKYTRDPKPDREDDIPF
ncbi:MAG: hypothetical protein EBS23_04030 [Betaproteobacteria bacterium]|nr:hypothetical protein [Betaproteobacteria bacterium]